MAAQAAAFFARRLHQRKALEEEHRKDARHQVEDDAAEKGEANRSDGGDAAGSLMRLRPRSRSHFAGRDCRGYVVSLRSA